MVHFKAHQIVFLLINTHSNTSCFFKAEVLDAVSSYVPFFTSSVSFHPHKLISPPSAKIAALI